MSNPSVPGNSLPKGPHLNGLGFASASSRPPAASPAGGDPCLDAYQSELSYLLRTFERLGVGSADVDDLAQEVFLVLRRTWREYDPDRALKPYLFGIAFRIASTHRRRWWREVPRAVIESPDHSPSPEREFEANQARALVLAALQRLPLARRAVLVMHDLDHVPVREVAATLSIPLFTAYSRLRKARLEIQDAISEMQSSQMQRRSTVR